MNKQTNYKKKRFTNWLYHNLMTISYVVVLFLWIISLMLCLFQTNCEDKQEASIDVKKHSVVLEGSSKHKIKNDDFPELSKNSSSIFGKSETISQSSKLSSIEDSSFLFNDEEPEKPLTFEEQVNAWVYEICENYPNVDPYLVQSVIWQESLYFPDAKNYDGSCVGLMQVSIRWHSERAKSLGVKDLMDPYGNILVGIDLLSELIEIANGDIPYALMMYNSGIVEAKRLHNSGRVTTYAVTIIQRQQELKEEANYV